MIYTEATFLIEGDVIGRAIPGTNQQRTNIAPSRLLQHSRHDRLAISTTTLCGDDRNILNLAFMLLPAHRDGSHQMLTGKGSVRGIRLISKSATNPLLILIGIAQD